MACGIRGRRILGVEAGAAEEGGTVDPRAEAVSADGGLDVVLLDAGERGEAGGAAGHKSSPQMPWEPEFNTGARGRLSRQLEFCCKMLIIARWKVYGAFPPLGFNHRQCL